LAAPGPGEVRCAVRAVAICHSDVTAADGGWGGHLPVVLGHEAAGVVLETGAGVAGLAPGDHAVITMVRHCGVCPCCARGLHGACEGDFPLNGATRLARADASPVGQGLKTGAFAEEVVVHASQVVAIDRDIGFDVASLLACGVITGYGAVANTAGIRADSDVAVIGTGGVGLNAVQGARLLGARRVIAVDLDEDKLAAAEGFGATHRVNGRGEDPAARVRALTEGRGADYVFVTVGVPSAFDQSYAMLAPGGMSVLVGVASLGARSVFDPIALNSGAQQIRGSKLACDIHREIPELIGHYRAGRLKLDELVTAHYPLEEINAAMDACRQGRGLRNVVMIG